MIVPALGWLIGPCGVSHSLSTDTSKAFAAAFLQPSDSMSDGWTPRAVGEWTQAMLRERLADMSYEDQRGRWRLGWSRVIAFEPYVGVGDFTSVGVLDPSVTTSLSLMANQDGGVHLVAFGAGQRRTIVAHFYIELRDMGGRVLVIEPEDVPAPTPRR